MNESHEIDKETYYEKEEEYDEIEEPEYEVSLKDVQDNLSDYIRVTYEYKQRLITGVHSIQVVVRNNSPYTLKSARVEVQYQRINNKIFDREYIQFSDVAPYSGMTQYAPDKKEGSFVRCSLLEGKVSK